MKVRDLSGKEHTWNPQKTLGFRRINASSLHINAVNFLRFIYPAMQILEEVYLPGEELYLDIYMPSIKTAVECQGQQHDQYNRFFHKNQKGYRRSIDRDSRKEQWCYVNNIRIIYFYPNESEDQWKLKLGMTS